jgi:hypothetical protein
MIAQGRRFSVVVRCASHARTPRKLSHVRRHICTPSVTPFFAIEINTILFDGLTVRRRRERQCIAMANNESTVADQLVVATSAALGQAAGVFCIFPLDVIKTRLQVCYCFKCADHCYPTCIARKDECDAKVNGCCTTRGTQWDVPLCSSAARSHFRSTSRRT